MSSVDEYLNLVGLPIGGAVRVSLGVASTLADVDAFLDFAERTYRDRWPDLAGLSARHARSPPAPTHVRPRPPASGTDMWPTVPVIGGTVGHTSG